MASLPTDPSACSAASASACGNTKASNAEVQAEQEAFLSCENTEAFRESWNAEVQAEKEKLEAILEQKLQETDNAELPGNVDWELTPTVNDAHQTTAGEEGTLKQKEVVLETCNVEPLEAKDNEQKAVMESEEAKPNDEMGPQLEGVEKLGLSTEEEEQPVSGNSSLWEVEESSIATSVHEAAGWQCVASRGSEPSHQQDGVAVNCQQSSRIALPGEQRIADEAQASTKADRVASHRDFFPPARPVHEITTERVQRQVYSEAETILLWLHREEAKAGHRGGGQLIARFFELFEKLPVGAVPRVRAALDSSLVFRIDGSPADLRSIVFQELSQQRRMKVLTKIHAACAPPSSDQRGFVVLSDVDDTLLPGSDALHIGGCDRSWHLDGRLYPGVTRLHRELRSGLRDAHGKDYSVLLTARPPFLVRSTAYKARRISGLNNPRLSILPGAGKALDVTRNVVNIIRGRFSKLGEIKVDRLVEYATLFPELVGRFVFIGDDGQGDLDAADAMLTVKGRHQCHGALPFVAFIAVHAVQRNKGESVPTAAREEKVRRLRAQHPPLPVRHSGVPGPDGAVRHRFFYFDDYMDLAEQLTAAGWLEAAQRDSVIRAFRRDYKPDPEKEVRNGNYLALRAALRTREPTIAEAISIYERAHGISPGMATRAQVERSAEGLSGWGWAEADDTELHAYKQAEAALEKVKWSHIRLAAPEPKASAMASAIDLQVLNIRRADGYVWPEMVTAKAQFLLRDINSQSSSSQQWEACSCALKSDESGLIRIPLGKDCALCNGRARCVIDIHALGHAARCFVVMDDEADALQDGQSISVMLLAVGEDFDVEKPVGNMMVKVQIVYKPI